MYRLAYMYPCLVANLELLSTLPKVYMYLVGKVVLHMKESTGDASEI